ncbi:MAG TPA: ABC transporter substrate-binding protein [Thermoanaerobaculia bacterium]|jgi:peptide/nickel transport system substrate-binding protein|nr:ABC transporter substrate-binding protein [Thermoanaerobaculia bacterium]
MITIVLVACFVACGGGEKKGGGGAGGAKDTLVIEFKSSPTNLDSRVGNDNASGRVADLIHSGLVKITPQNDYAPDVAQSWETTPDAKTVTFHLNPNAKFQNGQPLKAADVKWTYESLMDPNFTSSKKSGYSAVDHIEAPDDHTVIFRLKEPNGGLFDNLTLGILPTGADTNTYKTKPIGAGPYKVVDFRPDDRVELEAFDGWHGGAPKIKHVIIRIIPDATTAVLELRRGSVNFEVNTIPFENVDEFSKNADFKVEKKSGSVYQYLAFNMKDPILSRKPVRQAIAYAIDREKIARDVMRGYAEPTDTMLGKGHWARAENLPTYPYDPAKAKALLDQAGYRDPDGDGPRSRFSLSYKTSTDPEANLRAQVMQQMLKLVGIDVKIQSNELGKFLDDIGKGNFQLYSLSRNGIADPDFYYIIFYSKNVPPEGQNRGSYANPRVDQLIMEGRSTFDREKRKQIYAEVQKLVQEDLPYLSLYHQQNVTVMRNNIDGYVTYPAGFLLSVPQMTMK